MAFQLNTTPVSIPETTEGIYILPYTWFDYGLENGHLAIEDLVFYDTVQGSMYALAKQKKLPTTHDFGDGLCDIWLMYKSGSQEVRVIAEPQKSERGTWLYMDIRTPSGATIRNIALERVLSMDIQEQKDYNRNLIRLLKGCRVKLVQSVWKVNL